MRYVQSCLPRAAVREQVAACGFQAGQVVELVALAEAALLPAEESSAEDYERVVGELLQKP